MKFKDNFLSYTLIPLIVLFIGATYVRFVVMYDYTIEYEIDCDSSNTSCFIGCLDDECLETYYYKIIQKNAFELREQCGINISNCEFASTCLPDEESTCTLTHCDPDNTASECSVAEIVNTEPDQSLDAEATSQEYINSETI